MAPPSQYGSKLSIPLPSEETVSRFLELGKGEHLVSREIARPCVRELQVTDPVR